MQVAKRMQSRALAQMATATKKYPRFFHPHEVQAVADIDDNWETVDGEDPDVFLVPSGLMQTSRISPADAEESGIYDLGPASGRPVHSGPGQVARRSIHPTIPFRQPSRPDYAADEVFNFGPSASPLTAPPIAMFSLPMGPAANAPVITAPPSAVSPPPPSVVAPRSYTPFQFPSIPLPPSSQPLSGYMPNSVGGAVMSVGQPPPSLLATMAPRKQRPFGMYVAAAFAFALAGAGVFGGSHVAHGKGVALRQSVATEKAPLAAPAAAPAPSSASSDMPTMDLGAALANTSLSAPATPAPVASAPVAKAPAASASSAKVGPLGVRAKTALAAGDLSEASLLYAEMTETATGRLEGAIGLAEVARARGDNRGAVSRYKEILVNYPAYMPARLGLADAMWDSGDEAGARAQYISMQKSYTAKMLPPRVFDRSHE